MKNTALRIGNYVEYVGVICEVEEIHKKTITTNGVKAPISSFLSIPLTEEWLLRFGFKDGEVLENDNYKIIISFYDVWRLMYQEKEGYGNADCYLENYWSVHELQNLIFALTGEELTLNK